MAHPFLIKEIAQQAGLSEATVDRVLNNRDGVRKHTAQRVKQAIRELDGQSEQAGLTGRKFVVDVVMQAPDRFSESVRVALEEEMPALRPAVFRARYHFSEVAKLADLAAQIDRIATRGTHGLFLKAPDVPEIAAAIDRLTARGAPVVTLVTDIANCRRAAYVGMDNRAAGETAAYLIGEWLGSARAKILTTLSSNRFRGEEEREIGFRPSAKSALFRNSASSRSAKASVSTGRPARSFERRSPSSASPPSASCYENSAIQDNVPGQTLRDLPCRS